MKFSIGHKLSAASFVFIAAMTVLLVGSWLSLSQLRQMQDQGMLLVRTSALVEELSGKGATLYQIIADAEINRQFDATQTDWNAEKARTEALFDKLGEQLTSEDEKARLAQAKAGYKNYVDLFEQKMLPTLRTHAEMTQDVRDLDDQIDKACVAMSAPLEILKAQSAKSADALDIDFDNVSGDIMKFGTIVGISALFVGILVNSFVVRHVSGPLKTLAAMLLKLVNGETVVSIPHERRRDEVGAIANAVSAFRDNISAMKKLEDEQKAARDRLERDNQIALQVLKSAEEFERQIKGVASQVGDTSNSLNTAAITLDRAARDADERSASMASATSQSASNLQTVASATEELSASITEISRQIEETTVMTQAATDQARRTTQTVDNLALAASKIGAVVALIQDIAAQTNLLALNATIEAARAGSAGAGFAVVAGEVKSLSAQTSRATNEIRDQILGMQVVTNETVEAIRSINDTIERINGVTSSIAAGVTQQSAATADIANNVLQVAGGADTINSDLAHVSRASQMTSETSAEVLRGASDLSRQVDAMSHEVDVFLDMIRNKNAA